MTTGSSASATPRVLADAARVDQLVDELAARVLSGARDPRNLAFIGIRRRGDVLAQRVAGKLKIADVGSIDITLYRDDLSETGAAARVGKTDIPFAIEDRELVLFDDVIMTGRSALAALREILDFGRPASLRFAVLVERPEREIPIQADYAALKVAPGPTGKIDVRLRPQDEQDLIALTTRG